MTVKKIIDLEVNDASFQKFAALFKEYQDLLSKTPSAWQKVTKQIDSAADAAADVTDATKGVTKELEATTEAVEAVEAASEGVAEAARDVGTAFHQNVILLHQHNQITNQVAKVQPRIRDSAKEQAKSWHDMARDTKTFASNITGATTSLLRWASITGVISGLVGAGGLFGIDRLAISAGGQRRSALGLGVTPGEQSAFSLNFGRVVNADQMLGGVNEALTDPTKRVGLYGAGLTESDLKGKDAAQVSAALIPALKRLADQAPENMLGSVLRARHLDQFISAQDFQRLRNTPSGEIAGYGRQFAADSKGLDLTKGQQKAWQDLQVQLSRAGREIERTFIVGLTPLAPVIGRLSDSFTKAVEAFLGSPKIKDFLSDIGTGLDHFAKVVGTPEFATSVTDFAGDIVSLAEFIGRAIHKLANFLGGSDAPSPGVANPQKSWEIKPGDPGSSENPIKPDGPLWHLPKLGPTTGGSSGAPTASDPTGAAGMIPATFRSSAPAPAPGATPAAFRPGNDNFTSSITPALLASVEYQESRARDVTNPTSGAAGYFQFMPTTAQQYGVDPHNEASSLSGATRYLTDLEKQFGSVEKALAAYNWGPGNLKRDLAKYGEDWRRHLPKETQRYIEQITGRLPRQGGQFGQQFKDRSITVQIHNATGGNANVSVAQLSA